MMLNVVMLNVAMLSVDMLSVIMLSVVAPENINPKMVLKSDVNVVPVWRPIPECSAGNGGKVSRGRPGLRLDVEASRRARLGGHSRVEVVLLESQR
jgi:hypothetical protein